MENYINYGSSPEVIPVSYGLPMEQIPASTPAWMPGDFTRPMDGNIPDFTNMQMPMLTDEQLEMMYPEEYRSIYPHVMNMVSRTDPMGPVTPEMIDDMTRRVLMSSGMTDEDEAMPVMARFGHVGPRRRFNNRDLVRLLILRELLDRRRKHRHRHMRHDFF